MGDLVIVCAPAVPPSVAPCADVGGVAHAPAVVERPVITDAMASSLASWVGPVDWAQVSQFIGVALSAILTVWFVAYCVGAVLRVVRSV